jgi:hypothetical protein
MKKALLYFALLTVGFTAKAQDGIEVYHYGELTDYSGDTVYVTAPSYEMFDVTMEVFNNTGSTKIWRISRKRLYTPNNWADGLCWGHCEDPFGLCYGAAQMVGNPWTTSVDNFNILDGECGKLKPQINPDDFYSGTAHYRYYISEDGSTYQDSVDVVVDFIAAVKPVQAELSITVQPNPASEFVIINMNGADNGSLKVVDVLGNVVLRETISGSKKIDLGDFRNGVYFISIETGSGKNLTRKLIVRH